MSGTLEWVKRLTGSLERLVLHLDAHFEARELRARRRLNALELDVREEFVEQHYGPLVRHRQLLAPDDLCCVV